MTDWNRPQPAPKALWSIVYANFPVSRNLGVFVRRNVAGTQTPSLHSQGRALDIGLNAASDFERLVGDELFRIFCEFGKTLQLEEAIWRRQIWSLRRPTVHHYGGHSAHTDHIHVGFTETGSQQSAMPGVFHIRMAQLRTGLEDLRRGNAKLA
jgi:hypothetical protein